MYYMFFGHCHRTRFRDSFCLASVFEMTVYLLTYLLTYISFYRKTGVRGLTRVLTTLPILGNPLVINRTHAEVRDVLIWKKSLLVVDFG